MEKERTVHLQILLYVHFIIIISHEALSCDSWLSSEERKVHGFPRTDSFRCGIVGMKRCLLYCAVLLGEDACFYLGGSRQDKGILTRA